MLMDDMGGLNLKIFLEASRFKEELEQTFQSVKNDVGQLGKDIKNSFGEGFRYAKQHAEEFSNHFRNQLKRAVSAQSFGQDIMGGFRDVRNLFTGVISLIQNIRFAAVGAFNAIKKFVTAPFRFISTVLEQTRNALNSIFKTFEWIQYQFFMQFMNIWLYTKTILPVLETYVEYNREIYNTWALIGDAWETSLKKLKHGIEDIDIDSLTEELKKPVKDLQEYFATDFTEQFDKWLSDFGLAIAQEFGKIPQDVASALYQIVSATVPFENLYETITDAAKASIAGVTTLEKAIAGGIQATYAFGFSLENLNDIYNAQFATIKYGILRYEDLVKVMGRVYQPAASLSNTMENLQEMYATMAFATRVGLSPEMGAFGMARLYESLGRPAVLNNLAKIGIQAFDTTGKFRGLVSVVTELVAAIQGFSRETQAKMLSGLGFDMRAIRVLRSLVNNYTQYIALVEKFNTDISESAESGAGVMEQAYQRMRDSFAFQVDQLKASFESLKILFSESIVGVMLNYIEKLEKFVRSLVAILKEGTVTIGNFTIQLGALIKHMANFYLVFAASASIAGVFSAAISPLGLLIGGITVLMRSAMQGGQLFEKVVSKFEGFGAVIYATSQYVKLFIELLKDQDTPLAAFGTAFEMYFKDLGTMIGNMKNMQPVIESIKSLWDVIGAIFDKSKADKVITKINKELFDASGIVGQVDNLAEAIGYRLGDLFNSILQVITGFIEKLVGRSFDNVGEAVVASFKILYQSTMNFFARLFGEVNVKDFNLLTLVGKITTALGITVEESFNNFKFNEKFLAGVRNVISSAIGVIGRLFIKNFGNIVLPIAGFHITKAAIASLFSSAAALGSPFLGAMSGALKLAAVLYFTGVLLDWDWLNDIPQALKITIIPVIGLVGYSVITKLLPLLTAFFSGWVRALGKALVKLPIISGVVNWFRRMFFSATNELQRSQKMTSIMNVQANVVNVYGSQINQMPQGLRQMATKAVPKGYTATKAGVLVPKSSMATSAAGITRGFSWSSLIPYAVMGAGLAAPFFFGRGGDTEATRKSSSIEVAPTPSMVSFYEGLNVLLIENISMIEKWAKVASAISLIAGGGLIAASVLTGGITAAPGLSLTATGLAALFAAENIPNQEIDTENIANINQAGMADAYVGFFKPLLMEMLGIMKEDTDKSIWKSIQERLVNTEKLIGAGQPAERREFLQRVTIEYTPEQDLEEYYDLSKKIVPQYRELMLGSGTEKYKAPYISFDPYKTMVDAIGMESIPDFGDRAWWQDLGEGLKTLFVPFYAGKRELFARHEIEMTSEMLYGLFDLISAKGKELGISGIGTSPFEYLDIDKLKESRVSLASIEEYLEEEIKAASGRDKELLERWKTSIFLYINQISSFVDAGNLMEKSIGEILSGFQGLTDKIFISMPKPKLRISEELFTEVISIAEGLSIPERFFEYLNNQIEGVTGSIDEAVETAVQEFVNEIETQGYIPYTYGIDLSEKTKFASVLTGTIVPELVKMFENIVSIPGTTLKTELSRMFSDYIPEEIQTQEKPFSSENFATNFRTLFETLKTETLGGDKSAAKDLKELITYAQSQLGDLNIEDNLEVFREMAYVLRMTDFLSGEVGARATQALNDLAKISFPTAESQREVINLGEKLKEIFETERFKKLDEIPFEDIYEEAQPLIDELTELISEDMAGTIQTYRDRALTDMLGTILQNTLTQITGTGINFEGRRIFDVSTGVIFGGTAVETQLQASLMEGIEYYIQQFSGNIKSALDPSSGQVRDSIEKIMREAFDIVPGEAFTAFQQSFVNAMLQGINMPESQWAEELYRLLTTTGGDAAEDLREMLEGIGDAILLLEEELDSPATLSLLKYVTGMSLDETIDKIAKLGKDAASRFIDSFNNLARRMEEIYDTATQTIEQGVRLPDFATYSLENLSFKEHLLPSLTDEDISLIREQYGSTMLTAHETTGVMIEENLSKLFGEISKQKFMQLPNLDDITDKARSLAHQKMFKLEQMPIFDFTRIKQYLTSYFTLYEDQLDFLLDHDYESLLDLELGELRHIESSLAVLETSLKGDTNLRGIIKNAQDKVTAALNVLLAEGEDVDKALKEYYDTTLDFDTEELWDITGETWETPAAGDKDHIPTLPSKDEIKREIEKKYKSEWKESIDDLHTSLEDIDYNFRKYFTSTKEEVFSATAEVGQMISKGEFDITETRLAKGIEKSEKIALENLSLGQMEADIKNMVFANLEQMSTDLGEIFVFSDDVKKSVATVIDNYFVGKDFTEATENIGELETQLNALLSGQIEVTDESVRKLLELYDDGKAYIDESIVQGIKAILIARRVNESTAEFWALLSETPETMSQLFGIPTQEEQQKMINDMEQVIASTEGNLKNEREKIFNEYIVQTKKLTTLKPDDEAWATTASYVKNLHDVLSSITGNLNNIDNGGLESGLGKLTSAFDMLFDYIDTTGKTLSSIGSQIKTSLDKAYEDLENVTGITNLVEKMAQITFKETTPKDETGKDIILSMEDFTKYRSELNRETLENIFDIMQNIEDYDYSWDTLKSGFDEIGITFINSISQFKELFTIIETLTNDVEDVTAYGLGIRGLSIGDVDEKLSGIQQFLVDILPQKYFDQLEATLTEEQKKALNIQEKLIGGRDLTVVDILAVIGDTYEQITEEQRQALTDLGLDFLIGFYDKTIGEALPKLLDETIEGIDIEFNADKYFSGMFEMEQPWEAIKAKVDYYNQVFGQIFGKQRLVTGIRRNLTGKIVDQAALVDEELEHSQENISEIVASNALLFKTLNLGTKEFADEKITEAEAKDLLAYVDKFGGLEAYAEYYATLGNTVDKVQAQMSDEFSVLHSPLLEVGQWFFGFGDKFNFMFSQIGQWAGEVTAETFSEQNILDSLQSLGDTSLIDVGQFIGNALKTISIAFFGTTEEFKASWKKIGEEAKDLTLSTERVKEYEESLKTRYTLMWENYINQQTQELNTTNVRMVSTKGLQRIIGREVEVPLVGLDAQEVQTNIQNHVVGFLERNKQYIGTLENAVSNTITGTFDQLFSGVLTGFDSVVGDSSNWVLKILGGTTGIFGGLAKGFIEKKVLEPFEEKITERIVGSVAATSIEGTALENIITQEEFEGLTLGLVTDMTTVLGTLMGDIISAAREGKEITSYTSFSKLMPIFTQRFDKFYGAASESREVMADNLYAVYGEIFPVEIMQQLADQMEQGKVFKTEAKKQFTADTKILIDQIIGDVSEITGVSENWLQGILTILLRNEDTFEAILGSMEKIDVFINEQIDKLEAGERPTIGIEQSFETVRNQINEMLGKVSNTRKYAFKMPPENYPDLFVGLVLKEFTYEDLLTSFGYSLYSLYREGLTEVLTEVSKGADEKELNRILEDKQKQYRLEKNLFIESPQVREYLQTQFLEQMGGLGQYINLENIDLAQTSPEELRKVLQQQLQTQTIEETFDLETITEEWSNYVNEYINNLGVIDVPQLLRDTLISGGTPVQISELFGTKFFQEGTFKKLEKVRQTLNSLVGEDLKNTVEGYVTGYVTLAEIMKMNKQEFEVSEYYSLFQKQYKDLGTEELYDKVQDIAGTNIVKLIELMSGSLEDYQETLDRLFGSEQFKTKEAYAGTREVLDLFKAKEDTDYSLAYQAVISEISSWYSVYDFLSSDIVVNLEEYEELRKKLVAYIKEQTGETGITFEDIISSPDEYRELIKELMNQDSDLSGYIQEQMGVARKIPQSILEATDFKQALSKEFRFLGSPEKTMEDFANQLGIDLSNIEGLDETQKKQLYAKMYEYQDSLYDWIFNSIDAIAQKGQELGQQIERYAQTQGNSSLEQFGIAMQNIFSIISSISESVRYIGEIEEAWATYAQKKEEGGLEAIGAAIATFEPTIGALVAAFGAIMTFMEWIKESNSLTEAQLLYLDRNTTAIESLTDVIRNVSTEVYNAPQAFAYGYAVAADNQVEAQQFVPQNNYVVQDTVHTMQSELYEPKYFTKEGYANTPNYYDSQILYNTTNTNKFEINVTVNGNAEPEAITQSVEEGVIRAMKAKR